MRLRLPAFTTALLTAAMTAFASPASLDLMPAPAAGQLVPGRLAVTGSLRVAVHGWDDARLREGLARWLRRAEERTGFTFARQSSGEYALAETVATASVVIECTEAGLVVPALGENESYTLDVTSAQAVLRAPTVVGVLHGFATLTQLLRSDAAGWYLPAVKIADQPRFPWRGLMIDVARHWQPMDVIKRNIDGMALVKLNVLHLHLTEDQGFRIESKAFPRLHELGSDGHYFTQEQMRELIAYAAARGIRVVPEFDIPGHATSWVVGFPDLGSAPGPYRIERKWGIFDPVLDPTNPKVYELLDGFLGEMAALFPDGFIHIGGDENNGVQWSANPKIQAFIREHNLKDNAGLHAYFNGRVHAILAKHGKQLIGWDEILHVDLPASSVIHSWRGPEGLAAATHRGFAAILSNGYYIDLCHPTSTHYLNDPVPVTSALTAREQKLVLGGEATMWSEWVTPETIDSRIWPRTAAIAERLWSPREIREVPEMYRRLPIVSQRLEETGLQHEHYLDRALRQLAGEKATTADLAALRIFVDLIEPVKEYRRGGQQPGATSFTPLNGLVDCARPDSAAAREFSGDVDAVLGGQPRAGAALVALTQKLIEMEKVAAFLMTGLAAESPRLQEALPLLDSLAVACDVGQEAVRLWATGHAAESGWLEIQMTKLDRAAVAHAAAELPLIAALKRLVTAAAALPVKAPVAG